MKKQEFSHEDYTYDNMLADITRNRRKLEESIKRVIMYSGSIGLYENDTVEKNKAILRLNDLRKYMHECMGEYDNLLEKIKEYFTENCNKFTTKHVDPKNLKDSFEIVAIEYRRFYAGIHPVGY